MFAASLLAYFAWNTRRLITDEITQTVNSETSEINEIYGRRGMYGLVRTIEYRALRPGARDGAPHAAAGRGGGGGGGGVGWGAGRGGGLGGGRAGGPRPPTGGSR